MNKGSPPNCGSSAQKPLPQEVIHHHHLTLVGEPFSEAEMEEIAKEREKEFAEAKVLGALMKEARRHGVELEVAKDFIAEIRSGETAAAAAWHARCEWDI